MSLQEIRIGEILKFLASEAHDEIERPQYVQYPLDALARGFPRLSRGLRAVYLNDLAIKGLVMLYYEGQEVIGAQVLRKELAPADHETNALERIKQTLLQHKRTPQNSQNAIVHASEFKKVMRSANVQQIQFYIYLRKLEEAGFVRIYQEVNAKGLPSQRIHFVELMPQLLSK